MDDTDWKNTVDLVLPRNEIIRDNNQPRTTYGKIKKTLWEWYGPKWQYSDAPTFVASLADSTRTAVMTVKAATSPDTPWLFTGHSLGGGLATLAAFESRDPNVVAGNAQPLLKVAPTVITFGSVLVGDQNFAAAYNAKINTHCRVENLCDWVPALQGLNILAADSDPTGARVAAYVVSYAHLDCKL